jgi:hypothetical protein
MRRFTIRLEYPIAAVITAILCLILFNWIHRTRRIGMQTTCTANLAQIAFGLRCYHDKYQSRPGGSRCCDGDPRETLSHGEEVRGQYLA